MISYVAAKLSDTGTLGRESHGGFGHKLKPDANASTVQKRVLWVRIVRDSYSTHKPALVNY